MTLKIKDKKMNLAETMFETALYKDKLELNY